MHATDSSGVLDAAALQQKLTELARIEAGDGPFVSCFLDARDGLDACTAVLQRKMSAVRQSLDAASWLEYDNACWRLERELGRTWQATAQGIALFARSVTAGSHLSVMHTAQPFANQLTLYRVPDLLPLLQLQRTSAPFTVLRVGADHLEAMVVDLGQVTRSASLPFPGRARLPGDLRSVGSRSAELWLRRVLADDQRQVLVAAESALRDTITALLPRWLAPRLLDPLVLDHACGRDEVVELASRHVAGLRSTHDAMRLGRLLHTLRHGRHAVAGVVGSREALRTAQVETVFVSASAMPHAGAAAQLLDPPTELSRQACQRGIPVIPMDSDELRYLGGVACLLGYGAEGRSMVVPPRFGSLELVA